MKRQSQVTRTRHICEADNHALCQWLARKAIPVLHLERRNRVRQALSLKLATTTGLWGVERSGQREDYARRLRTVTITPTELANMAEWLEGTERSYKKTLSVGRVMVVHYEDLYAVCGKRRQKTVYDILRFLGLKVDIADLLTAARRLHPSRKQTTTDVVGALPNAEDIEAVLGNGDGE